MDQESESKTNCEDNQPVHRPGEAAIKAEYLLPINKAGEVNKGHYADDRPNQEGKNSLSEDVTAKRIKLSEEGASEDGTTVSTESAGAEQKKEDGETDQRAADGGHKKEKQRGRNRQRPGRARQPPAEKLCPVLKDVLASEPEPSCTFSGRCHFLHDPAAYVASKPADLGPQCHMYTEHGRCPSGLTCRFGASHITPKQRSSEGDPERWAAYQTLRPSRNAINKDVQRQLWKRRYDFSTSNAAVQRFDRRPAAAQRGGRGAARQKADGPDRQTETAETTETPMDSAPVETGRSENSVASAPAPASEAAAALAPASEAASAPAPASEAAAALAPASEAASAPAPASEAAAALAPASEAASAPAPASEAAAALAPASEAAAAPTQDIVSAADPAAEVAKAAAPASEATGAGDGAQPAAPSEKPIGPHSDADLVRPRLPEKKKVVWEDQLYLAPLTTVGNLPFRRLCRRLGADITCGEMAMASNLLQGSQAEWALVRRHHSESVFGAQICGNNPGVLSRCSQLLNETCELDFIDINLGCPIDLVYMQGSGSAMMRKRAMLENTCRSIASVIDIPLTLKMRTGVVRGTNLAHGLITSAAGWGVDMVTLHGRSREQRYTKLSDWQYVAECARAAAPLPLFGNGDVLSWEEYEAKKAASGVAGIMVARGALIKPWIFTEIKERRTWDIRSSERLDLLKEYTNHGLEHWGSDTEGVEKTRRFLLEWLSFLHRYIPAGLLERQPQRVNERPPAYRGRDDLETLMASGNCRDWVTISEMLLGKVPDSFEFLPKHKASSYG